MFGCFERALFSSISNHSLALPASIMTQHFTAHQMRYWIDEYTCTKVCVMCERVYRFWVSYFCATPIQRKNEANLKYNRQQCCHNTMLSMCAIFQTSFKQVYDLTVNAVSYHIVPHRCWSYRVCIISAGFDMPFFFNSFEIINFKNWTK